MIDLIIWDDRRISNIVRVWCVYTFKSNSRENQEKS